MKNPNFTYSKFHKKHKAMKAHIEALQKRGAILVDGGDKKTTNAIAMAYDNDKGGYWVFYRFGKEQLSPKYKVGQKFNAVESVGGKGIVKITRVSPDKYGRHKYNYYELNAVSGMTMDNEWISEKEIEEAIDNGSFRIIRK